MGRFLVFLIFVSLAIWGISVLGYNYEADALEDHKNLVAGDTEDLGFAVTSNHYTSERYIEIIEAGGLGAFWLAMKRGLIVLGLFILVLAMVPVIFMVFIIKGVGSILS